MVNGVHYAPTSFPQVVGLDGVFAVASQRSASGFGWRRRRYPEVDELAAELDRVTAGLNGALDELRELARGIHPAILTNRGLAAALQDLAGRAPIPVRVVATPAERLPDQVEAAVYFVVSECLANVGKHAQAQREIGRAHV